MKNLRRRSRFKRDYNLLLLAEVIELLRCGESLPPSLKDHQLKGTWEGWRECHIEPDWLLIYKTTDKEVLVTATGTHADLFE